MDYQKLDPMLASELDAGLRAAVDGIPPVTRRELPVFVHVADPVASTDVESMARRLHGLGVEEPVHPGSVLTMSLSAEQVSALSEEPWVVAIRAARPLRTLS